MTIFNPLEITLLAPNHFGFGGLDRDVLAREHENCLDLIIRHPETRIVPVWHSRNLFSETGETGATPVPAYLTPEEAAGLISHCQGSGLSWKTNP